MDKEDIVKMAREVGIPTGRIGGYDKELKRFADLVAAAVAEPEQEPVAWMHNFIEGGISIGKKPTDLNRHPDRWTALYKDPTPCKTCQALAMAVMNDQTYHEKITPKREWVGLTDEDIHDAFNFTEIVKQLSWDREPERWCKNFAAYIEAKLKEKNS